MNMTGLKNEWAKQGHGAAFVDETPGKRIPRGDDTKLLAYKLEHYIPL